MARLLVSIILALQVAGTMAAPMGTSSSLEARQNNKGGKANGGGAGKGGAGGAPSAAAVQKAADNFAGDVSIVSNSLNTLITTTNTAARTKLAKAGFDAETDEDNQRSVLFASGKNTAANGLIVKFTPTVLDGLKSIQNNPSQANTEKQVKTMETARNANILPSITKLTQSAFQAAGVNAQAKTFASTTGSKSAGAAGAGNGGAKGGAGNGGAKGGAGAGNGGAKGGAGNGNGGAKGGAGAKAAGGKKNNNNKRDDDDEAEAEDANTTQEQEDAMAQSVDKRDDGDDAEAEDAHTTQAEEDAMAQSVDKRDDGDDAEAEDAHTTQAEEDAMAAESD
ncbi:hypothetical protein PG996_008949 [Apiospora saccharicola]|uniref:Uncharacterized protein n=1 Tax=Apiospora saccharicola TaxID=335842 RepID=A0ABR1V046_9PEZI